MSSRQFIPMIFDNPNFDNPKWVFPSKNLEILLNVGPAHDWQLATDNWQLLICH